MKLHRPPGADSLAKMLRGVVDNANPEEFGLVGAMTAAQTADTLVEQYDAVALGIQGHRATPAQLRLLAEAAEKQAAELRRIAASRETEAS